MEVSGRRQGPAALPPGKVLLIPMGKEAVWAHSRSGRGGEEKNSQPLPGLELPIIQPVAQRYTTELSGLLTAWSYYRNFGHMKTLNFAFFSNKIKFVNLIP
jgi:hypothetical protein